MMAGEQDMNIAWLIEDWRKQEGLSIAAAAERIGIPANSLRCLEQGNGIRSVYWIKLERWLTELR
jgi:transcriptional regulator with XRE-family HTH domain